MTLPVIVALLMVVNAVVLTKFSDTSQKLVEQRSMTIQIKDELQGTSQRLEALSTEKMGVETSLKEERLKTQEMQSENESLKENLQAKKEREAEQARLASVTVQEQTIAPAPTATVTGGKADWLAASGIPSHEWGYVDSIVSRESGWNPNAVNRSSGACGLGQQLPCGKWAGAWNDPVAALVAMNGYVHGRYGGWAQAYNFWNANHWY